MVDLGGPPLVRKNGKVYYFGPLFEGKKITLQCYFFKICFYKFLNEKCGDLIVFL